MLSGVRDLVNENTKKSELKDIDFDAMLEFRRFEETDFTKRFNIKYINSTLKENMYLIFICVIAYIPLILIGNPGCSKSLATALSTTSSI
jgi:MoxR-like ATPase